MPALKWTECRRIINKAKRMLGLKRGIRERNAQDRFDFMNQCMQEVMDDGEAADMEDARSICELLYEEEADLYG